MMELRFYAKQFSVTGIQLKENSQKLEFIHLVRLPGIEGQEVPKHLRASECLQVLEDSSLAVSLPLNGGGNEQN
jgi:hypothetical protein